jgi:O-antigen/teichoic acid export membrane protein
VGYVSSFRRILSVRPEFFGVLDYGLSSLATFLIGLYAARTLDPASLGVYALCFRAVFLGGIVPSQGVFLPAENLVTALPLGQRLSLMRHTLRLGATTAAVSALGMSLWVILAPPLAPWAALTGLTITGVVTAFASPVQDHVRRMLHLGGASQIAALVSAVQFGMVVVSLVICAAAGVSIWWAPLGTLAVANLVSLAVGVRHARRHGPRTGTNAVLSRGEIRRSGRWLVLLGVLDAGAIFMVAALVAHIAGAAALGYAEAARIAANPVLVLAWGLSAVLRARSVRAGRELNAEQARKISRTFGGILALAGAASLTLFTTNWWGNPMGWLLPNAYVIPGLVGLSILAYLANGFGFPYWWELVGARLERSIAKAEIKANVLRTFLAGTAVVTHAYAVPLSLLGFGVGRWLGFHRILTVLYGRRTPTEAATLL